MPQSNLEPGVFVGASATTTGTNGLVPRPPAGPENRVLGASGDWVPGLFNPTTGQLAFDGGTVTASIPILDLSQTWNNGAVAFQGINFDVTDTASSFSSRLLRIRVGGGEVFGVTKVGTVVASTFQGTSSGSFNFNSDTYLVRGAANTLDLRNSTAAQTWNVYGTYTDASNYRRLRSTMTTGGAATIAAEGLGTGVSGNLLAFSIDGVTVCNFTTSTAAFNGNVQAASTASLMCASRGRLFSPADGQFLMVNNASTDADFFLKLGVNTSAAAGIKRVGTVLQSRLNDDSAFATIQGKLRTDNAYAAGAPGAATGTVTITDSTGTAYRIPVLV